MKRKKVIQGISIAMMIIGLLTCCFGVGWQMGLFEGILPSSEPKVYDWSDMNIEKQDTENSDTQDVTDETTDVESDADVSESENKDTESTSESTVSEDTPGDISDNAE